MHASIIFSLFTSISLILMGIYFKFSLSSLFIVLGYPHFILAEYYALKKVNYKKSIILFHAIVFLLHLFVYFLPVHSNYLAAIAAWLFVAHVYIDETRTLTPNGSKWFRGGLLVVCVYLAISVLVKILGFFTESIGHYLLPFHIIMEYAFLILYHYTRWYIFKSYLSKALFVNIVVIGFFALNVNATLPVLNEFFTLRGFWLATIFHIVASFDGLFRTFLNKHT